MPGSVRVVTAPQSEPLTVADVRARARIDAAAEELVIEAMIKEAREAAETYLHRALITQTRELALDCFPPVIELPFPPIGAVSSVTYVDANGATQPLAATEYDVDAYSSPGRVAPKFGKSWPSVQPGMNRVLVRYTCGYGDGDKVPAAIKSGLYLLIGHKFENREAVNVGNIVTELPWGVKSFWDPLVVHGA